MIERNSTLQTAQPVDPGTAVPFGKRLKSLDGLRGLAILAVIAEHTLRLHHPATVFDRLWAAVQESSWAGVDLFFVLSGFLITGILLDSRQDKRYFTNFYARRTLRIFPLYYAVLAVAIWIVPAAVGYSRLPEMYTRLVANQAWLWTYLQNYLQASGPHALPGFGHFWSLAVEEQFYWIWPAAVFLLPKRYLLRLCVVVCAVLPLLRLTLILTGDRNWAIRQYTFTRVDTLVWGGLVALLVRDAQLVQTFRRVAKVLIALAACVLAAILFRDGFVPYEGTDTLLVGYSALGILFAALVYHCVIRGGSIPNFFSGKFWRWFGKYSYAIYVFHWPVTQAYTGIVEKHLPFESPYLSAVCCCLFVVAVSSATAYLSWHLFEDRILRLKRFFEYDRATSQSRTPRLAVIDAAEAA